jgi:hypothetical protein
VSHEATLKGRGAMHTQEYRYKEDPETSGSILVQKALNRDQDAFEALGEASPDRQ